MNFVSNCLLKSLGFEVAFPQDEVKIIVKKSKNCLCILDYSGFIKWHITDRACRSTGISIPSAWYR
jgi:hypothetical protein